MVLCFQGPSANGMPELHGLTPSLQILQDKGYKVGLVTDGRMSGASGKVPNAIHITPDTLNGGNIAKIKDGDIIELDLENGILRAEVSDNEFASRMPLNANLSGNEVGMGRELFYGFRRLVSSAEDGGSAILSLS